MNRQRVLNIILSCICIILISSCNDKPLDCVLKYNFTIDGVNYKSSCDLVMAPSEYDEEVMQLITGSDYELRLIENVKQVLQVYIDDEKDDDIIDNVTIGFDKDGFYGIKVCDSDMNCITKWVNVMESTNDDSPEMAVEESDVYQDQETSSIPSTSIVYESDTDIDNTYDTQIDVEQKPPLEYNIPPAPDGFEYTGEVENGVRLLRKTKEEKLTENYDSYSTNQSTAEEEINSELDKDVSPPVVTKPVVAEKSTGIEKTVIEELPKVVTQEDAEDFLKGHRKTLKIVDQGCEGSFATSDKYVMRIIPKEYIKLKSIQIESNEIWIADISLRNETDGKILSKPGGADIINSNSSLSLGIDYVLYPNQEYTLSLKPKKGGVSLKSFDACSTKKFSDTNLSVEYTGYEFVSAIRYSK